ncbi:hypothetical protein SAMN05216389_1116 [Oceanobacillus limi]|uniref:Uncharacterized protein n=1 Tax=Oceanobacillus limi TaxID=930131 RepID=A0A1I0EAK6_9BACI|nr:hypothetical protein [Oceanobacillus limi]SET42081.1 hypothetical protein SAMN05216389_1116 [Oceanobacillus limi]
MAKSYLRGHEIEQVNGEWVYVDTKEPTEETWQQRACGHCHKHATTEGHDACLGTLPGVMNACCGHGQDDEAYVQFLDTSIIRGCDSLEIMNILRKYATNNRDGGIR